MVPQQTDPMDSVFSPFLSPPLIVHTMYIHNTYIHSWSNPIYSQGFHLPLICWWVQSKYPSPKLHTLTWYTHLHSGGTLNSACLKLLTTTPLHTPKINLWSSKFMNLKIHRRCQWGHTYRGISGSKGGTLFAKFLKWKWNAHWGPAVPTSVSSTALPFWRASLGWLILPSYSLNHTNYQFLTAQN